MINTSIPTSEYETLWTSDVSMVMNCGVLRHLIPPGNCVVLRHLISPWKLLFSGQLYWLLYPFSYESFACLK